LTTICLTLIKEEQFIPHVGGKWLLKQLLIKIEEKIWENPTVAQLAEELFISSVHLRRIFKEAFGLPLVQYIRSRRLAASLDQLCSSSIGIADLAVNAGFDYAQSYIRAFKKEFGLTPGEVRKLEKDIKFIYRCPSLLIEDGEVYGG